MRYAPGFALLARYVSVFLSEQLQSFVSAMLVHLSMNICRFDSVSAESFDGALFSSRVSSANAPAAPCDVEKAWAATADDVASETARIPSRISLTYRMVLSTFKIYVILDFVYVNKEFSCYLPLKLQRACLLLVVTMLSFSQCSISLQLPQVS